MEASAAATGEPTAGERAADSLIRVAAALSGAAGLIHASVIAVHFREYWVFGVFFVVVALFQWGWAFAIWTRRDDWTLLAIGAGANLAVALIWALTRTIGIPVGRELGNVEAAGLHDLLATASELGVVLAVGLALGAGESGEARGARLVAPLWVLAAISALVAFLGGGGHA